MYVRIPARREFLRLSVWAAARGFARSTDCVYARVLMPRALSYSGREAQHVPTYGNTRRHTANDDWTRGGHFANNISLIISSSSPPLARWWPPLTSGGHCMLSETHVDQVSRSSPCPYPKLIQIQIHKMQFSTLFVHWISSNCA